MTETKNCDRCGGPMHRTYPIGLEPGEALWCCSPCQINVNRLRNPNFEVWKRGDYEPSWVKGRPAKP